MAAETEAIVRRLHALAADRPGNARPRPDRAAHRAHRSHRCLDVYRTYADGTGLDAADRARIDEALAEARRRRPFLEPLAFDLLERVLTLAPRPTRPPSASSSSRPGHRQGPRGQGALPLQPADRAQRGRQRAGAFQPRPRSLPRRQRRAPGDRAARAAHHLDPRHQARRGRPPAHRGARRPRRGWRGRRLARLLPEAAPSTRTRPGSSSSCCSAPGRPSGVRDRPRPAGLPPSPRASAMLKSRARPTATPPG
jgi:hypothetical protein